MSIVECRMDANALFPAMPLPKTSNGLLDMIVTVGGLYQYSYILAGFHTPMASCWRSSRTPWDFFLLLPPSSVSPATSSNSASNTQTKHADGVIEFTSACSFQDTDPMGYCLPHKDYKANSIWSRDECFFLYNTAGGRSCI